MLTSLEKAGFVCTSCLRAAAEGDQSRYRTYQCPIGDYGSATSTSRTWVSDCSRTSSSDNGCWLLLVITLLNDEGIIFRNDLIIEAQTIVI